MTDPLVRLVSLISANMDKLVRIENDVFDIGARLREIDGGYYPVYNLTKKRFEVHHSGSKNSLQVVLPYPCLDKRAIDRVRETRLEYVENMLREMDESNEKKRLDSEKRRMDEADELIERYSCLVRRS